MDSVLGSVAAGAAVAVVGVGVEQEIPVAKRQADDTAKQASGAAVENEAPKRPGCGCHRCGAAHTVVTRGVRQHTMKGTVRYVTCPECGWTFSTLQAHGSEVEEVLTP